MTRAKQLATGMVERLCDTAESEGWLVGISSPSKQSWLPDRKVQMAPKRVPVTGMKTPQCAARLWLASEREIVTTPSRVGPTKSGVPTQSVPLKV